MQSPPTRAGAADVDVAPDAGAGPDLDTLLDDRRRVNLRPLTPQSVGARPTVAAHSSPSRTRTHRELVSER